VTNRYVIIAEDELGARLARDLAERVVTERGPSWLQELWLDDLGRTQHRRWTGFSSDQPWSSRGEVKKRAEELGIRAHGHGMKAERAFAHKAAQIAAKLTANKTIEPVHALFLVHDTDGDAHLEANLREGAVGNGGRPPFEIIVAAPHPESEAWVVAGALVGPGEVKPRHEAERQRLGFDPVTSPERLTSNRATDKRDAKRVCAAIVGDCGDNYAAWEKCWRESPLDLLEQNAARAGLRSYIKQIEEILLPMLGARTPPKHGS